MGGRPDRFRKNQAILDAAARGPLPVPTATPEAMQAVLAEGGDEAWLLALVSAENPDLATLRRCDLTATQEEVDDLLTSLGTAYDAEKLDSLVETLKDGVIASLLGPFGLTRAMLADPDGGAVQTLHNAREGVFAKEEYGRNMGAQYNKNDYAKGRNNDGKVVSFGALRKEMMQDGQPIKDAYSGKALPNDGRMHIDHTVSAKEVHDGHAGMQVFLSPERRVELATQRDNLNPMDSSANQSKGDKDYRLWASRKGKDGRTNAERFKHDPGKADAAYRRARKAVIGKGKSESKLRQAGDFGVAAAKEVGTLGLRQALGVILGEFASGVIAEFRDARKNGFRSITPDGGFIDALCARFNRVAANVASKWETMLEATASGTVSGLLSLIVSTLVNRFKTLAGNMIRIVREGLLGLLRAVRMLMMPPRGMSARTAAQEAAKVVAASIVTVVGVVGQESLQGALESALAPIPPLLPLAAPISLVVAGLATAVASGLVVYMIDRMDLFGASAENRHKFIMSRLDEMMAKNESTGFDELMLALEARPATLKA